MTNDIGLLFWPPLAGNRIQIYICARDLFASLGRFAERAMLVDATEFQDWCANNNLVLPDDGDFGSLKFPDEQAQVHFKLRWW